MQEQLQQEPLGFVIPDVARMVRREFDRRAQVIGLTRAQWSVLAQLYREDGLQQRELAERLELTAITLTGLLDRLERDGWVERRADPADRRAKHIFLTDKVEPVMKTLRQLGKETMDMACVGISKNEQETLLKLLLKMRSNLCTR